jgi:hypothetical protein
MELSYLERFWSLLEDFLKIRFLYGEIFEFQKCWKFFINFLSFFSNNKKIVKENIESSRILYFLKWGKKN